jgi:competence protein ComEC
VAALGGLLLLLPRGLPHRFLGLMLIMPVLASGQPPLEGRLRVDVLDVGQGTAVLLSSQNHLLVYDSGPGDGKVFQQVDPVILPAMVQAGFTSPDRILISHADLDHAGGAVRLRKLFPTIPINASLPGERLNGRPCVQGLSWEWDGIDFEVLHPGKYLPYRGNDSSCVLSIHLDGVSVLLPGDISAAIEQRLVQHGLGEHDILLVPHHGSKTSSTGAFLNALQPGIALATAGLGNRFGFPRVEIQQRYRELGIPLWSTGACGALRIELQAGGRVLVTSARRARPAPWRWPAAADCPLKQSFPLPGNM